MKPIVATLDLEGVFTPEVWIRVAEETEVDELKLTTRDIPNYDELMRHRLKILAKEDIRLADIQGIIAKIKPLEGAKIFLEQLKAKYPVLILSDTFYEFAAPLLKQLDHPTLFCHSLVVDDEDRIIDYQLRLPDQKRKTVEALQKLNFAVIAAGDSYNDISMLKAADRGILFRPPPKVIADFPQFPITNLYQDLLDEFAKATQALQA